MVIFWRLIAVAACGTGLADLASAQSSARFEAMEVAIDLRPEVLPAGSEALRVPAGLDLKEVLLHDALEALQISTSVPLIYSPSQLPRISVSCTCAEHSLGEALERLLSPQEFEFVDRGGQILIRTRQASPSAPPYRHAVVPTVAGAASPTEEVQMLRDSGPQSRSVISTVLVTVLAATSAFAQQPQNHQVAGTVTSTEMAPLGGVSVMVEGTTIGTVTNATGNYALIAPSGTASLVFTSLGMGRLVVPIQGRNVINVTLETEAIALSDVVVVGYGEQARAMVTGSVSQVTAEDIERTSATTVGDALVGKLAGINTRSGYQGVSGRQARDGRPGTPPNLEIRNLGAPLFVIDGVPRGESDFNHLNPADIESISVLKDASAAVYGLRASNGVVLVTTKKGSTLEPPRLQINAYYGWQNIPRSLFPFGYGVTAYQQIYSVLEHEQNIGVARSRTPEEMQHWLTAPTYQTWDAVVNNPNAPQMSLNASVSGGAGNATYYFSVGHVNQDYVMLDNNFNRTNLQANLSSEVFPGLRIGAELSGRIETDMNIAATSIADPVQNLFRAVQSPHSHQDWYANGNPNYIAGDVRILARTPPSMRREISGAQDQIERAATANLWSEYLFPFGLKVRGTYSSRYYTEDFDFQTKTFDAYCYDQATDTYNVCGGVYGPVRRHVKAGSTGEFGQLLFTYSGLTLGQHSLSAVGGYEFNGNENRTTSLESVPPLNSSHLISHTNVTNSSTSWNINRRASYMGRMNYDFQKKYLLEGLARYDGSHLYPPGQRWGFFPGVSAGWRISEEPFMRDRFNFLNEFKFRASWGQAGREQGVNSWGYLEGATYNSGGAVLDGQRVTGVAIRGLPVTNISWVTSTSRNVGFDFEVLERKLSGEFDVFRRTLTGIPASRYDVVLPSEVGFSLPNENLNSDHNLGLDFVLRWTDRVGDLRYSVSPNFTLARAKAGERYKPRYQNSWHQYRNQAENRWSGTVWGLQAIGQFQSLEEVLNHPVNIDGQGNRTLLPGDWIFADVNGDGIINALDQRPIAWPSGTPRLQYGLNGNFQWRDFGLSYDIYGGTNYSHATDLDRVIPYNADHGGAAYWNSRWRRADVFDDQSEWVPGKFPPLRRGQQNHSSYRTSSYTVTNMNYIRLNRVEVSYNVPRDFASRFAVAQARVYASSANPYVVQLHGQRWASDPENGGNQLYPKSQVINLGFRATMGAGVRAPAPVVPLPPVADDD